jgi:acetyl-CoA acyltransferase
VPREIRDVVFVDGVRTPFGKAKGQYAETRADDLVIKCIRELLRRNPSLPPDRVDEVAIAATTQIWRVCRTPRPATPSIGCAPAR